jgi:CheY-like chemotaxis protein
LTTTLLAVDDSKTMRKVLEITFSGEDFRLITCGSADDAMSKLSERPAVALVDAGLDGTSGYELCKRLKAAQPSLGVVILSNKQQPFDKALGGQVGADDFADKPFDTQQLIDKVSALAKKVGAAMGTPAPAPVAAAPAPAPRPLTATLQYGTSPAGIPSAPVPAHVAAASAPPAARPIAPSMPTGPAFASRAPTVSAQVPTEGARPAPAPFHAPPAAAAPVAAAPVAAALSGTNGADFAKKLGSLGLTSEQVNGVLSLSREVLERVAWEVVPTLAETIIREEIQRLTRE